MADIELVIKIPEEVKQAFDCAESSELKGGYYDHGGVIGNAIKNGTPLPKGHGKLIDAGLLNKSLETAQVNLEDELSKAFDDGLTWASEVLNGAPTIIEADTED